MYAMGTITSEKRTYTVLKQIDRPWYRLFLRSDGIVQLNTTDDAYFTTHEGINFIHDLAKITGGVPHLILKVPGKHASVDNETRSMMARPEALQFSIAEAVIIRNLAQRLIGNFYIRIDRPHKPVRLFTEMDEAEKWLKSCRSYDSH